MKRLIVAALFAVSLSAHATSNNVTLYTPAEINKVLKDIPAGKETLGEMLTRLGLKVISVQLADADQTDIDDGTFTNRKGDKFFTFKLKQPIPKHFACEIQSTFSLTLRDRRYVADSRTANFLVNGECSGKK